MPKLKPIIIDLSGIGGLSSRYFGDPIYSEGNPLLRTLAADNQYVDGFCNPIAKFGYMSPATTTTKAVTIDGANNFLGIVRAGQVDVINTDFFVAHSEPAGGTDYGSVRKMANFTGVEFSIVSTFIAEWDGAGTEITDLEMYEVNGVRKLFAAYQQTGGGNIAMIATSNMAVDPDWLSAACSGGSTLGATNNIVMVVADNGFMYVLDGSTLHKIDGTTNGGANGTATMNVLTFPAIFQLIDGLDLRGLMWIALMKSTRDITSITSMAAQEYCGVYIWDRQSTSVSMADFIPITGVKEIRNIFSFNGLPSCFTVSSDGYTQLRIYDGNEFKIVQEMEKDACPVYKDSLSNTGDMITWIGKNGFIYKYGKIVPELEFNSLYKIGDMSGKITNFNNAGILLEANSAESTTTGYNTTPEAYYIGIAGNTTPANLMKKWYPHALKPAATDQYPLAGNVYSKVIPLPKLSKVKSLTLYYPPLASSGTTTAYSLDVYFNQSATVWGNTLLTRTDGVRGYKFIPVNKTGVNYIQLKGSWNTTSANVYAITPSYASVEVETTGKKI